MAGETAAYPSTDVSATAWPALAWLVSAVGTCTCTLSLLAPAILRHTDHAPPNS